VIYLILGHKAQSLLDHPNPRIVVRLPIRQNSKTTTAKAATATKASKQAAVRKSVPVNGQEWLTSKNTSNNKVASKKPTTTSKKPPAAAAAKTKKVAVNSKAKKAVKGTSQKKVGTTKTKKKVTSKQGQATTIDTDIVIELSSDESADIHHQSDDENEF
jgi:hypothetical protein